MDNDDQQQKDQIDENARLAKEKIDTEAFNARQALADEESERITKEADDTIAQIQYDAQK